MGTNSALLAKRVIDNAYQVQAIEMIALLQAVDFMKAADKLSETTRKYYNVLRELVPIFVEDSPMHKDIEKLKMAMHNNSASQ